MTSCCAMKRPPVALAHRRWRCTSVAQSEPGHGGGSVSTRVGGDATGTARRRAVHARPAWRRCSRLALQRSPSTPRPLTVKSISRNCPIMTPVVLGVDIGTSSSKGVLVGRRAARCCASAMREHSVARPATRARRDGRRRLVGGVRRHWRELLGGAGACDVRRRGQRHGPVRAADRRRRHAAAPRDPLRRRHPRHRPDRRGSPPTRRRRCHPRRGAARRCRPRRSARRSPGWPSTSRTCSTPPGGCTCRAPGWCAGSPAPTCSITTRPASHARCTTRTPQDWYEPWVDRHRARPGAARRCCGRAT